MKRKIALLLCSAMLLGGLAGCGTSTKNVETDTKKVENQMAETEGLMTESETVTDRELLIRTQSENASVSAISGTKMDNVSYVMIYNPFIYDEGDGTVDVETGAQSTGDMSSQIIVGMNKAGGLDPDIEIPTVRSQAENDANVDTTGINREGIRLGGMDPSYNVNDRHDFYHSDVTMTQTLLSTFDCVYSGANCYIWTLNGSLTPEQAQMMGQEFDTRIYANNTQAFGKARFTDNGGKINLLFYPMQEGLGGYFTMADIFSSAEVPVEYITQYGFNVDHAIVHINSDYMTIDPNFAVSTMAHEFQHLICASDCFYYAETPWMATWLNEAMSAYAEELNYPGIKEAGYYNQFMYLSNNFRTGQSLYNFDTQYDEYIGAYGAVYLFSRYLEQMDGPEVFSKIHEYWRNSYRADITEGNALASAVSDETFQRINDKYTYAPRIYSELLGTDMSLWISKLTLDFHIETLKADLANLHGLEDQMHAAMLYSEIGPVEIEGGGRILVATQNGSYEIPADADWGLVYIGLDSNFNVVSMYSVQ